MKQGPLISVLFLIAVLGFEKHAAAECWQITTRDGLTLEVTEIWNLSSKLEETPQGFLLGRLDGDQVEVPVADIQSIDFQNDKPAGWRSWFKDGATRAQISFINGRQSSLDMDLNIFYRLKGEKKHLPASTVMSETADNSGMDLNIFYRAKGDVKQVPVGKLLHIERCDEALEAKNAAQDIAVQRTPLSQARPAPASGVPAGRGEGDVLELMNSDQLSGTVTTTPIRWKTAYGVLEIGRDDIQSLTLDDNSEQGGQIVLMSGDRVSGYLANEILTIRLSIGQSLDIPVEKLRSLQLRSVSED